MTKQIYKLKEELIKYVDDQFSKRGVQNVNTGEMGQVVDMIKDLAEAEHHCWEACYYKSVVEAMNNSKGGKMGYGSGVGSNAPQGYGRTMADTMGYTDSMMGYSKHGVAEEIAELIKGNPALKTEISQMLMQ